MNHPNPPSLIRKPLAGAVAHCLLNLRLGFWLGLFFAASTAPGQEVEPDHPFRFGFSMGLMPEVNENDYRAAMKVWGEAIVKDGAVNADPNIVFCPDIPTMITALQNHTVDGVALKLTDFFEVQKQVRFNHCIFGVAGGSIYDEFVVLVHQDSPLTKLEDLQGRSINLVQLPQMVLALPWLDTLLLERGLKPTRGFCGRVTEEAKLTKAVLPVFFRQTDACLVTRKGFQTMCELNPQLGRQLRVLAASPKFVATGFFFRDGYPPALQAKCLAEFTQIHTRVSGQQVLTVFQSERLEEHPVSDLDSTLELLAKHERLMGRTNQLRATIATPASADTGKGEANRR